MSRLLMINCFICSVCFTKKCNNSINMTSHAQSTLIGTPYPEGDDGNHDPGEDDKWLENGQ